MPDSTSSPSTSSSSMQGGQPPQPGTPDKPGSEPAQLGPVLREQAGRLADRSKDAGADTAAALGKAAERAAHELEGEVPELANYVRNAANYTQQLADGLRHRSAADLLQEAVSWGRQQPMMALAGAALLGFALSRVVKTGLPSGASDSDERGGGQA